MSVIWTPHNRERPVHVDLAGETAVGSDACDTGGGQPHAAARPVAQGRHGRDTNERTSVGSVSRSSKDENNSMVQACRVFVCAVVGHVVIGRRYGRRNARRDRWYDVAMCDMCSPLPLYTASTAG